MKQKWTHLKHRIGHWLFSDIYGKIELERESFQVVQSKLREERTQFQAWAQKQTPTDAVRHQLGGFNILFTDDNIDWSELVDQESFMDFLSQASDLSKNDTLKTILKYLITHQVLYTAKEADSTGALNFGRGTINGFSLLEEELESLDLRYQQEKPQRPDNEVEEYNDYNE